MKLWDDHTQRVIETLSYTNDVVGVRFRNDKLVVVLINKVYVYNFADMTLIDCIETSHNPEGLCELNPDTTVGVLAIPDKEDGGVRVRVYSQVISSGQGVDHLYPAAHKTPVTTLALTRNGEYLATAGQSGTKVKIWSTNIQEGEVPAPIYTVRRGLDKAEIRALVFSKSNKYLAASSDHATVHVFKLPMDENGQLDATKAEEVKETNNTSMMLKIFAKFSSLPLSYARWQIETQGQKKYLAFNEEETQLLIATKGNHYFTLPIQPGD